MMLVVLKSLILFDMNFNNVTEVLGGNFHCVRPKVEWSIIGAVSQIVFVFEEKNCNSQGPVGRHMARVYNGIDEVCHPVSYYTFFQVLDVLLVDCLGQVH